MGATVIDSKQIISSIKINYIMFLEMQLIYNYHRSKYNNLFVAIKFLNKRNYLTKTK